MNLHEFKVSFLFVTVLTYSSSTRPGELTCHVNPAHATECTEHRQGEGYAAPVTVGKVSDDRTEEYHYIGLALRFLFLAR